MNCFFMEISKKAKLKQPYPVIISRTSHQLGGKGEHMMLVVSITLYVLGIHPSIVEISYKTKGSLVRGMNSSRKT